MQLYPSMFRCNTIGNIKLIKPFIKFIIGVKFYLSCSTIFTS